MCECAAFVNQSVRVVLRKYVKERVYVACGSVAESPCVLFVHGGLREKARVWATKAVLEVVHVCGARGWGQ